MTLWFVFGALGLFEGGLWNGEVKGKDEEPCAAPNNTSWMQFAALIFVYTVVGLSCVWMVQCCGGCICCPQGCDDDSWEDGEDEAAYVRERRRVDARPSAQAMRHQGGRSGYTASADGEIRP
jgi:hypothetical protein